MARPTFNRNAICRADGNSEIYEVSHKAHKNALKENHKKALFLTVQPSAKRVISDEEEITITAWNMKVRIKYGVARAAKLVE